MRSRLSRSSAVLVVLSLLLSACGLPGASGQASPSVQKIKLKTAYSAVSVSQLPVYVAREMGLFERQGLDVDLTYIATGTTLTAAMLGGEVHVAVLAEDGVILADLRGADLVMIAAGPERLLFSLYANPSIRSISDLKGSPIADVTVLVRDLEGKGVARAVSDAGGNYSVGGLSPGAYNLIAKDQSAVTYVPKEGVTVNWGISPNTAPVALARRGIRAAGGSINAKRPLSPMSLDSK